MNIKFIQPSTNANQPTLLNPALPLNIPSMAKGDPDGSGNIINKSF